MASPFSNLHFRYPFRAYQARVLNQLSVHLRDGKVHIVAPPGAGKTILGLEIIKQLDQNCLVLVPTITIRNQWVQRLFEDFVGEIPFPKEHISHQLDKPATLTVVTYQALHFALKKSDNTLGQLSFFTTIVVDECHHLKREWWRSLNQVTEKHQPVLVALTATPPFDASGLEWRRYHDFCGAIDEEITTPELVESGDLCPHQDFIWPVLPNIEEQQLLKKFTEKRTEFWSFLAAYQSLNIHIQEHPWMYRPQAYYEDLYERPEYFTAMLSIMKFLGSEPPIATLGVLHGEATIPPDLDHSWLKYFFEYALYDDPHWQNHRGKEVLAPLKQRLSRMGAIERRKIHLDIPVDLAKKLRKSSNKLTAVAEIVQLEHEKLDKELRAVILTDFIRSDALATTEYDLPDLNELGAVPIFEFLRRGAYDYPPMALLTGSLIIIPKSCKSILQDLAQRDGIHITFSDLSGLNDYLKVGTSISSGKKMVEWVTELFNDGAVKIIVGTQALLGEGWDAPAINSLVLANTVGSYVLSNQMRGRAIRIHKEYPKKTSNIWHLVTIDNAAKDGGSDLKLLKRRFGAFIGPNHSGMAYLSNDFDRMLSLPFIETAEKLKNAQQQIRLLARGREGLRQRWEEALEGGEQLVTVIQPPAIYEKQEDGLSRYFYLKAGESVEGLFSKLSIGMIACILISFFLPLVVLLFKVVSFSTLFNWSIALGVLGGAVGSTRIVQLIQALIQLKPKGIFEKIIIYPVFILSFGFYFAYSTNPFFGYCFLLFTTFSIGMYLLFTKIPLLKTWRFYKRIGDIKQLSFSIGKSILEAMAKSGLVQKEVEGKLQVKEDKTGTPLLYLEKASRFESELLEIALSEFFAPVEKQRYLLAIQAPAAKEKEVHYMAVPSVFKNKKTAEAFCESITDAFDQNIRLIYTRTPAGRLHLLNARLQVLDLNEDSKVKKEKIWL